MYKICICDDMIDEIENITKNIECYFNNYKIDYHIDQFISSLALNSILLGEDSPGTSYDIFFLDILMPDLDGIDLAKKIREKDRNCAIVFITSSVNYALTGYKVDATDYILKPFHQEDINYCLNKIMEQITRKDTLAIKLSSKNASITFNLQNLLYLESDDHYVNFYFSDNQIQKIYGSLSDFELSLTKYKFMSRCHKSFIVNFLHIKEYTGKAFVLNNGLKITISRTYLGECKRKYFNYEIENAIYGK